MATTIVTKFGGDAPAASDIVRGELAVDTENGRLYTENSSGAVVEIGLKPEGNVDVTGTVTATKLVSADGVLELDDNGTHNGVINAPATLFINIDSDANSTGEDFIVGKDRTGTSGGTELFRVQENGNVGIGTSSIDGTLHLDAGASTDIIIEKDNAGYGTLRFHNDGSQVSYIQLDAAEDMIYYAGSGVDQIFYANNAEAMRINSSGVGIGTTGASSVALTVKSTGNTDSALVVQQTGNTDGWGLTPDNTNGNLDFVRIGGGAGTYFRLGVDGSLSTPTAGTSNVRFGANAGNSILDGGNYNVVVGDDAGTALTTGDANVAVGFRALDLEDTGSTSVAVGAWALSAQANGGNAYNTAVGYLAGEKITTGANNTFVGALAGDGTDDGAGNVAVGAAALSANCGDDNTAVGIGALSAATGSQNTAIGYYAMGQGVASGTDNTTLGYAAGFALSSGSNNLFLGHDAGRTGSPGGNQTTGSGSIILGDDNIGDAYIQVDWTVASDARDKTDFTALDLGLDFVKALNPVTYKWDKRSKYGDKTAEDYDLNAQTPDGTHKEDWLDIGFKAQEVEALEIAAGYNKDNKTNLTTSLTSDGKQMGLQYSKFVPILVKAIQELSAQNAALTARIEALES